MYVRTYVVLLYTTGSSVRNVNIFLVLQDAFIQSRSSHLGKTLLDTILRFTSISLSLLPTSLTSSLTVCLSSLSYSPYYSTATLAHSSYTTIFFFPYGFAVLWGTSKC